MSQFIVGLTGGIGSGKTTVSDLFAAKGIDIIDADVIARDVVSPGTPALSAIIDHFGKDIVTDNGLLDRARLRDKIFNNAQEKDWLNQLLHPLIREQMRVQSRNARSPYAILSVPLLLENNLTYLVDRVLVVDISVEKQRQRASQRDDVDATQIDKIIAAQISGDQRLAAADDIIDNNGEAESLHAQVEALHHKYLQLSAK